LHSPNEQEDSLRYGRFVENPGVSLSRRFLFAFYGLLAGDTALFVLLLPGFARAAEVLVLYGLFSFVGWAIIGLPVALGVPPRFLCRLSWPQRLVVGAALGPLALLAIFVMLAARGGTLESFNSLSRLGLTLANTGVFWPMSMLVSTTSFIVYTALLRRQAVLR
jgi:hypothetical protein